MVRHPASILSAVTLLLPTILAAADPALLSVDFEGDPQGCTLSAEGVASSATEAVIAGKRSLVIDSTASPAEWHEVFNSGDGVVPPHATVELRFDYRWLAKPADGYLYCLLRSRSDAKRDIGWTEKHFDDFSGREGVVRRVLTIGDLADYRLMIGVHDRGRVAVDNVTLRTITRTPVTAPPPLAVGPPPAAPGHAWIPVPELTDEFAGTAIDTAKWEPGNGGWQGRAPAWFDPRNLAESAGKLALTLRRSDYAADPVLAGLPKEYHTWTSASLRSRVKQEYGFFEIRAQPVMATASSAFWFADDGAEIDMFEIGGSAPEHAFTVHSTVHVFPKPWNRNIPHWARHSSWDLDQRPVDGFHIYSLQWDEQSIIMRVDGAEVAHFANTDWHRPMPVIFDIETMPDWFGLPKDDDALPASFLIDWIHTWKLE